MRRSLSRHTDSLSHLTVNGGLARGSTLVDTLLHVGTVALIVSLAQCLLLLLLCLPLFPDLFELCNINKSV
jgi:hypothetical protein